MSKRIYDGFRAVRPQAPSFQNGWFKQLIVEIPDFVGEVYSGDLIYGIFQGD
jgi:hypothetical protein